MKPLADELELARFYTKDLAFEGLTDKQMNAIMDRGRALHKWSKSHPNTHNLINVVVLVFLGIADFLTLLVLPLSLLHPADNIAWILLAGVAVGSLHSWIIYSLGIFSLHEAAAHKIVFIGRGPVTRTANFIAGHLCRISGGEPEFYAAHHMAHHAKFGTEEDGEFLNFITPWRYWATFLPLAALLNLSDFVIHRPARFTKGRMISVVAASIYHGVYGYVMYRRFGLLFTITVFALLPHVGFYLDRLRQFMEHNLMPLDNKNGSRSFGLGFWGLLVGGGPWGSPCHWEHHLVASLPWYQQLALHRYVKTILTPRQREQFFIEPVIGFPKLWWRLVRESNWLVRNRDAGAAQSSFSHSPGE